MEYYSAVKKNEIFSFVTKWVQLEAIYLVKSVSLRQIYDFPDL